VFAQLPSAGTIVAPGTSVAIVVSTGAPEDATTVAVPNVVGEELPDAREILQDAGFSIEEVSVPGTAENSQDVLAQVPSAGSAAAPGSTVTLLFAE
jgi:serine/threonine-protein kinase